MPAGLDQMVLTSSAAAAPPAYALPRPLPELFLQARTRRPAPDPPAKASSAAGDGQRRSACDGTGWS